MVAVCSVASPAGSPPTQTAEDDGGASRGDRRGDGGAATAANAPPAVVTLEQWAEQAEQHHPELKDFTWSTGFGTSCDDAETRRCIEIIERAMASAAKCHDTFEAVVAGDMKFLGVEERSGLP